MCIICDSRNNIHFFVFFCQENDTPITIDSFSKNSIYVAAKRKTLMLKIANDLLCNAFYFFMITTGITALKLKLDIVAFIEINLCIDSKGIINQLITFQILAKCYF